MKKIILTLGVFMLAQSCFAYLEEGETASVKNLQNSGYSQATLKAMDRAVEQAQGSNEQYVRYYKDYKPKNKAAAFYSRAKIYLDPAQEDDFFGRHENDMNNAWFPDLHDSSVRINEESVESL